MKKSWSRGRETEINLSPKLRFTRIISRNYSVPLWTELAVKLRLGHRLDVIKLEICIMQIRRTRKTVNVEVSWERERTSEVGSSCIHEHFYAQLREHTEHCSEVERPKRENHFYPAFEVKNLIFLLFSKYTAKNGYFAYKWDGRSVNKL